VKKVFIPVVLTSVLLLTLLSAGCNGGTAAGEVITEEKDFSNFTSVEIGSAFDFDIKQSDTYSVIIEADESLFDYVEVSQTSSKLIIYLNPHHIFTDFTLGAKVLRVSITMPELHGLSVSGASEGTVVGFSSSQAFTLVVSGASSLKMADIGASNVSYEVSGASRVSGNITSNNSRFEISGASSLELSGSAGATYLIVSGASRADLADLVLISADVTLSGASETTVNVKQRLDINVSGASRLYFIGNPTLGNTNISGASTIKHK